MMCMQTETFHVSTIASNAIMVIYGILFGGVHPIEMAIQLFLVTASVQQLMYQMAS